jgi:hypothetical protein
MGDAVAFEDLPDRFDAAAGGHTETDAVALVFDELHERRKLAVVITDEGVVDIGHQKGVETDQAAADGVPGDRCPCRQRDCGR